MSYFTYKITMDPNTFETIVMEMTVPSTYGECPLGKRRITNEEVQSKWSKEEFIDELSKYGYEHSALTHINTYKLFQ